MDDKWKITPLYQQRAENSSVSTFTLDQLADFLQILGSLDSAKELYQKSLSQKIVEFGKDSKEVAESFKSLAKLMSFQGKYREST